VSDVPLKPVRLEPIAFCPLIVGNWKMNGLGSAVAEAREVAEALRAEPVRARVAICAPATLIERLARAVKGSALIIGGEDVHPEASGAFTGDVSAAMLADAGARMVIVGHSERRRAYGETNALVAHKAMAALRGGLEPIICVGETLAEREGGHALDVVCRQARGSAPLASDGMAFSLAYEPIWAIGGGQIPTRNQIEEMHGALREVLIEMFGVPGGVVPILYGGSVDQGSVANVLKAREVGGALIGRASLSATEFLSIVRAAE